MQHYQEPQHPRGKAMPGSIHFKREALEDLAGGARDIHIRRYQNHVCKHGLRMEVRLIGEPQLPHRG